MLFLSHIIVYLNIQVLIMIIQAYFSVFDFQIFFIKITTKYPSINLHYILATFIIRLSLSYFT